MLKSLSVLFTYFLFCSALSAQNYIDEDLSESAQFSPYLIGGVERNDAEFYLQFGRDRANIRATIDTSRRFSRIGGVFQQTLESHYDFDSKFNLIFIRDLSSDPVDGLRPTREIYAVYDQNNNLLSDTAYYFHYETGERILDYKREILYDDDGSWVGTLTEIWLNDDQKWQPDILLERELENGLRISQTRKEWNTSSMTYDVVRVENWEYEHPDRITKYQLFTLGVMDELQLDFEIIREFDGNGNLIVHTAYSVISPEINLRPDYKTEYMYDDNQLVQEISFEATGDSINTWVFNNRYSYEYYDMDKISSTIVEDWLEDPEEWEVTSRIQTEYDSYGNRIKSLNSTPLTLPDSWLIGINTEYQYNYDYEPGSFIPTTDVNTLEHMQTGRFTRRGIDFDSDTILRLEYIYNIVDPNSVHNPAFEAIKIFPNPFSSYIQINLEELNIPMSRVEIFSVNGIMCLGQQIHQNAQLQVSHLIPGMYTLILKDENGKTLGSRKMIKR